MMAFDFKKEYKEFYMPKNRPEIIEVPEMNYVAVRGTGDPNEVDGAYQKAIGILYAIAYTLKMSYKGDYNPSINLCIAICKVLGKTLDQLFWEDDEYENQ